MEKTKTAWKIVSDPYTPEEKWLPACDPASGTGLSASQDSSSGQLPSHAGAICPSPPAVNLAGLIKVAGASSLAAVLGGALAGQAVHTMYYSYHLVGQALQDFGAFEPWGAFYYWFNQPCSQLAYLPILFSYSFGFLGRAHGLGKSATIGCLAIVGIYFISVLGYIPLAEHMDYSRLWLAVGGIGSLVAYFLGRTVSSSLSATIKPNALFKAAMIGLSPALLLLFPPALSSFAIVLAVCLITPCLVGWFVSRSSAASSIKTSVSLALSACSPLVLCGLLHIPIAVWFALVLWPLDVVSMPHIALGRGLVYFLSIPIAVILAAVAGGYLGGRAGRDLPRLTLQ